MLRHNAHLVHLGELLLKILFRYSRKTWMDHLDHLSKPHESPSWVWFARLQLVNAGQGDSGCDGCRSTPRVCSDGATAHKLLSLQQTVCDKLLGSDGDSRVSHGDVDVPVFLFSSSVVTRVCILRVNVGFVFV